MSRCALIIQVFKGHTKQIKKAADAILNAKRLVVYSGGGVILSDTSEQLTELVESLNGAMHQYANGLRRYTGYPP